MNNGIHVACVALVDNAGDAGQLARHHHWQRIERLIRTLATLGARRQRGDNIFTLVIMLGNAVVMARVLREERAEETGEELGEFGAFLKSVLYVWLS